MDHKETLKGMLQDIINGKEEQAAVTMHDYFVAKTKEVSGFGPGLEDADLSDHLEDAELAEDE